MQRIRRLICLALGHDYLPLVLRWDYADDGGAVITEWSFAHCRCCGLDAADEMERWGRIRTRRSDESYRRQLLAISPPPPDVLPGRPPGV